MGYPTAPGTPVPDKYGRTDSDEWIVWEEKTRDNVTWALRQLDFGFRILRSLQRRVDMLGISLERFDPKEGWTWDHEGYLIRRGQLGQAPHEISALKVMIEQRGR